MKSDYCAASASTKISVSKDLRSRYPITLDHSGQPTNMGRVTVTVNGIGGSTATRAILKWKEYR